MPKLAGHHAYRWTTFLVVLMVILALGIGGTALYHIEQRLLAASGESLALAAADIADKLDRTLSERYSDIKILAQAPVFRGRDAAVKTSVLQSRKATYPYYLWLGVTDAQGRIVAATDPASMGKDRGQRNWFKDVRDRGGIHVRDAQTSEDSGGVLAIAFTAPILGPRGEFQGVVTSRVSLPVLEDVFRQTVQTLQFQRGSASKIEYQFLSRDGEVIADSLLRQEGAVNLKNMGLPSALSTGSAQPGYIEETHLRRHVPVVTGYAQTEQSGDYLGLHWGILVRIDRSDILAPINAILWKLGLAGGVVFVPLLGFLLWATRELRQEWAVAQEETTHATAAEAAVREREERTRLIINTALDAVIVMDARGLIIDWNTQAETIFGWSRSEAIGRLLSDTIVPPQHREAHSRGLKHFLATGEGPVLNKRIEITACRRDGREFPVELAISPMRSGETYTFSAFVRDIAERKRAEAELKTAKEAAESANRAKSEFLASMSHEIRTPMNAIIGMADLLAGTPLSEEQSKYVQIFRRAGDTLLNLINEILDLSKVEAAQLELEQTGFDLNDVVEKASEMLAVRAHEKCLELVCYVAPEVPTWLIGDPTRLRQVLVNLLGNAIKFTVVGEVVLRVEVEKEEEESTVLRFSVKDSGIGIPPDKLDAIFDRFVQVDSSTTRKHGGTGLGLAITKSLVELMGGRIRVESALGFGSTFSFTVRLGVQPPTQRTPKFTPVQLRGLRVLVVDDNDTNRLILRELLSAWKAVVTEAATGQAALDELRRAHESAAPYELVLLDCHMPGMDGFQVAEAIRNNSTLAGVTMMMLTSDDRQENIRRGRELGLAGYAVKPIRKTDLIEAVATAVGQRRSAASPVPAEAPLEAAAAHPPLSILLVEDSADNQLLIQAYLKPMPYRIDVADNGSIAVAKCRTRTYDLVLMDMQMPVMDGYAATQAIREWEQANHRPPTPIIALTAYALKGDEEKSLAAGCTAHLTKPIKKAALLAAILEHTRSPVT